MLYWPSNYSFFRRALSQNYDIIKHNANVTWHYVKRNVAYKKLQTVSDLIQRNEIVKISKKFVFSYSNLIFMKQQPSKHSSWWRRLENVLKMSFVFVFVTSIQVFFCKVYKISKNIIFYRKATVAASEV